MTRKEFLQKYGKRFAVSLLLVGMIVYTLFHVFGNSSGSLGTLPARSITDIQILSGRAYLFREETVFTATGNGIVNDLAQSGTKVGKDVPLAEVWSGYETEELDAVQLRLDRLNRFISVLEKSKVLAGNTLLDAEKYRAEAQAIYHEIRFMVESGDYTSVTGLEDEMLAFLNRYGTLIGKESEIDTLLDAFLAERANLLRGDCITVKSAESSGYFFNRTYVDGYESLFTSAALQSLTVEGFASLIAQAPQFSPDGIAVGKMVYGYTWSLAMNLPSDTVALLREGAAYDFTFPENADRKLEMTCTRVITGEGGSLVAVFSTNDVPTDFTYLRSQSVEIEVGSTDGYYVPESALYHVNGMDGVYVFEESTVYFRRVDILYRGDGYVIVAEQGDRGSDYLALNDLMVTSGKNLYDGRVYE